MGDCYRRKERVRERLNSQKEQESGRGRKRYWGRGNRVVGRRTEKKRDSEQDRVKERFGERKVRM